MSSPQSEAENNAQRPLALYRKCHVMPEVSITPSDAEAALGPGASQQDIADMMLAMKKLKASINAWAKVSLKADFLEIAVAEELKINGRVVKEFSEIGPAYAADSSDDMQEKMTEILFGAWRANKGWAKRKADQCMEELGIGYIEEEPNKKGRKVKGFVEKFMSAKYNDLKSQINAKGRAAHGVMIKLRKDSGAEPLDAETERKRQRIMDGTKSKHHVKGAETGARTGQVKSAFAVPPPPSLVQEGMGAATAEIESLKKQISELQAENEIVSLKREVSELKAEKEIMSLKMEISKLKSENEALRASATSS